MNRYNSTFKQKPIVPLKRSGFKKGTKSRKTTKRASGGIPEWIKAVPEGSHGSGTLQKRLWKLTSDYVRIRDWYKYGGVCIATGSKIRHWSEGDAGHWKSYSVCKGMFKFDPLNIHLQSKSSNGWGGQELGHTFGENLKKRYGEGILDQIVTTNRDTPLKFTKQEILDQMEWLLADFLSLPDRPEYHARAYRLIKESS